MCTHLTRLTKASLYFVLALGLAMVAFIMVSIPGLQEKLGEGDSYMLTPVVSVALMMFVLTGDGYSKAGLQILGLHSLVLRSWPLAVVAPVLLLTCTYVLAWIFGIGSPGWSKTPALGQVLFLLVMQIIFDAAEEIGWRGYLLPHLLPLGRARALVISGLCHGYWHLPVMLMTPFYH